MRRFLVALGILLGVVLAILSFQRWVYSTTLAPGYSETAFWKILGDRASQVREAIGEPLFEIDLGASGDGRYAAAWEYAAPTRAKFSKVRVVILTNEIVDSKMSGFHRR